MRASKWCWIAVAALLLGGLRASSADTPSADVFERGNLAAWCVVPFDSCKRGPEARAEMLTRLGIFQIAYDWRAEHIPTFDEEMETLKRWGIKLSAFWFPDTLNDDAQRILEVLKRHQIQTELWVSMHGGEIDCTPEEQRQRVTQHVTALRPIVEAAAAIGCKVGLYNHGGWFGEPENQIEILRALDAPNVGLVYNLHHGHGHLDRFKPLLDDMKPYLYCLNLNGMNKDGDQTGDKILPLGNGAYDLELLRTIRDSGYAGPIGVLGHTMDDAEDTLRDNLDGLEWLRTQLDGGPLPGPRPPLRVGSVVTAYGVPSLSPAFGAALGGSLRTEGNPAYRTPPITFECRVRLRGCANFNILAASDTKASGAHWEVFTEATTGNLVVYTPGLEPDHLRTGRSLCDGQWHRVAMHYDTARLRLYLDGELVGDQAVQPKGLPEVPGGFGIGRLVEGGLFCDGYLDEVRVSTGIRDEPGGASPLDSDNATLQLWNFDDLPPETDHRSALEVEDPARRAALPEYQVIPAAQPESLTPALPVPETYYTTWSRSHGDPHNSRYAAFSQINRENVHQLEVAWEYTTPGNPGNVQCNPIVVDGVMYAPRPWGHVVAVDATKGNELWRFQLEGRPAYRGLLHWPGDADHGPRLYFTSEAYLFALDPKTGTLVESFGEGGTVATGESRVAPTIHKNVLILPLFLRDVVGIDVLTGERLWTFHTIPEGDEYGADTWDGPEEGANCWGGMALDDSRGIAYISTGSPKPNFAGNTHLGQNLFANCVLALDALTGERRWHFQEIRHDIWDLDIPAPPNLVSVEWNGRRVDVVAQTTKLGNTLVLDRVTGAPLFPFRLRRAPVSVLPGERTWPYQPDLQLPEPFARQVFTEDDVTEQSYEARTDILARIANTNYGWFQPFEQDKPTVLYGFHGGAEWTGAAVDPSTGRLYVSANNVPWIVTVFQPDEVTRDPAAPPTRGELVFKENCAKCHGENRQGEGMYPPLQGLGRRLDDAQVRELLKTGRNLMPIAPETLTEEDIQALLDYLFLRDVPEGAVHAAVSGNRPRYTHNGYPKLLDPEGYPGCRPPWGTLNCIDLASGKIRWQVPLGVYPDLADWGITDTGSENFGGPSVTAGGLVFCAGTPDEMIRAFNSDTGEVLWEHKLPFGGYVPPTIYEADGREYVLIAATGGGKLGTPVGGVYVAFALPARFSATGTS